MPLVLDTAHPLTPMQLDGEADEEAPAAGVAAAGGGETQSCPLAAEAAASPRNEGARMIMTPAVRRIVKEHDVDL